MSLHLVPAGEESAHEPHIACPCQPRFDVRQRPDGTRGRVVDHTRREQDQDQTEE